MKTHSDKALMSAELTPTELTPTELAALPDSDIDYSDIPELDDDFWKSAKVVMPETTQPVTLRVKSSVLEAFKATGKGYQTRMNAVLESYVRSLKHDHR
ncbi:BrnA antitoxin family protein [Asticcacaulis sp. EMRT-3]|uniref:BrnA antitoxin family protein n=1 Tax=Asticcacaulis sp. EMRT-3 TaxID=3040349 RepID=UPI0024AFC3F9|nr:BrnA antitoxin family protein [Asticcacaulis sp. EMRT-3]MDI7776174.1 BrnA antitoxin family protein [Asticcacaulis sp. EMRT-3]